MENRLFRAEALEKHTTPEQLDKLLQLTGPRDWLWLAAVLLSAGSLVLWAFAGRLPREVAAVGIIDHTRGVPDVVAPVAGLVREILVHPNQDLAADQVAVTLLASDGSLRKLAAPGPSLVSAIWIRPGMYVQPGMILVTLGQRGQPYHADVYVAASEALQIRPGMRVRCSPFTVRPEVYGYAMGRVVEVANVMSSTQEMEYLLRDPEVVQNLRKSEMVYHVLVVLDQTDRTPSGLVWSGGQGPPWNLGDFTRCRMSLTLGDQRPIEVLFPRAGSINP
jgi:hypothetical protein